MGQEQKRGSAFYWGETPPPLLIGRMVMRLLYTSVLSGSSV